MEVTYTHCAGLDVHKKSVVACCLISDGKGSVQNESCTFGTMTAELLALSDWLTQHGVTHVAMESTGEYWKPIYNLLEGNFTLLVVNAGHMKQVPGRETDVKDAAWIADLLRHGLLRSSFIPPRPQRELRDLTRQRTNLTQERTRVVQRLQKVLEWANLKLSWDSPVMMDTIISLYKVWARREYYDRATTTIYERVQNRSSAAGPRGWQVALRGGA